MSLKINPEIALVKVNDYIEEVDCLLKLSFNEGYPKKAELNSKIIGFIGQTFEDADSKLKKYSRQPPRVFVVGPATTPQRKNEGKRQKEYMSGLAKIKRFLIQYYEEISIVLDSQKNNRKFPVESFKDTMEVVETAEVGDSIGEIKELLIDLEILIEGCEGDIGKDASVSYKNYVNDYNNILSRLKELGYFQSLEPIIAELEAQHLIPLPPFEQAKLKEIISNSKKLSHRLRIIVNTETNKVDEINDILQLIFDRFQIVAQQLKQRHDSRDTLRIEDEYDVQDLLHALLRIYFDDVRDEEVTPRYAAKSSRIDFLLMNESIAVEVKFARQDSDKKKIGDELLIDIGRYQKHNNVQELYCFIYNHELKIINSADLEEISGKHDSLNVYVFVRPTYHKSN